MKQPREAPVPIREMEELASFTECTGLIPAGVTSEEEAESYAGLYGVHPVKPGSSPCEAPQAKKRRETE